MKTIKNSNSGSALAFLKGISQQDNQKAFDANEAREKQCIEWLKAKKKEFNLSIKIVGLIGVANGILAIIQAALLAYLFQQLLIEKIAWQQLTQFFLFLCLVFIFRSISSYSFQVLGFKVSTTVKRSVREALLNKFFMLGPAHTKQHQSGELATLTLEQTEALEGYFSRFLPQQFIVSILPLVIIAVVIPVNWVVAVIFLLTGPLIPLFMMLVGMGATSAHRNQFLALSRMSAYFFDRIQGLTTLKLFGQAETELDKVRHVATDFREKTMEVLRVAFLSSAVLEFFSAVAIALIAVYVGLGLLGLITFGPAANITLQDALFVLLLAPEFFNPLKQLAVNYHDKAAAIGAADQLLKILEQPDNRLSDQQRGSPEFCIEFQNVSKSYLQKDIIKVLSLQIRAGEKIALTGQSGVGKTTLFNLLLGFEPVTQGNIFIHGNRISQQLVEKNIAWAGQQPTIFYATIQDNISLFKPDITLSQINTAADLAGVSEFSKSLDKGLQTLIGEKGYGLSGGQIQRIALARAFTKDASIILLDEPTAHLDQQNKTKLLDKIDRLFKNKTLIIASHDPQVIARMNRTINLI